MHGIKVLMAKNYIDNLSEEVKKGMLEKAEQGQYPSKAPLGYKNNTLTHVIDVDPETAPLGQELFRLYATQRHSLKQLATASGSLNWQTEPTISTSNSPTKSGQNSSNSYFRALR
jgi:site-specific DNA recombinase